MDIVTVSKTLGCCSKLKRFIDQKSLDNYTPATKMEAAKWKHEAINTWLSFLFRVVYTCRDHRLNRCLTCRESEWIVASPAGTHLQGFRPILCLTYRESDRFLASPAGTPDGFAASLCRLQQLSGFDEIRRFPSTSHAPAFQSYKGVLVLFYFSELYRLCVCVCVCVYIYN